MENTTRQSDVIKYLDELDMLSYRLADKLDMVLNPPTPTPTPTVAGIDKDINQPSTLVIRLKNLTSQLRDIDNRINL